MERKEFLSLVGVGSASILSAICLGGCTKSGSGGGNVTPPSNVDFTLDLSQAVNAKLLSSGGYIYNNGIIVAHTLAGKYIAVSQACTHEGVTVQYIGQSKEFYCPSHGAIFSETGTVVSGPAGRSLMQYQTTLTGTSLRVFS